MLHIYNTLSRTKETFKPVHAGEVRIYVCGMTVYDYCHLGHARMLVAFDVVQRWLRASGYAVNYVRNITDIDDKIIRRAVQTGRRMHEVTDYFIAAMHADERALAVERPDHEPRATAYVGEMIDIIGRLEKNGLAYQADDGDVNYAVRGFQGYGKLSGKSLDDLRAGERVAVGSSKRDPLDFVLWKSAKEEEPPETKWDSPYGFGRPGWHIECSAMSKSLLGLPLDIHGGGPDLKFPHHENEIAQTEGAFGGTLANIWMHCGPLMVDAEKMSKSLGNFRTIRQTIAQGEAQDGEADYQANPREAEMLRFFIVRNHYRSPQNYTPDNLVDAQNALDRLYQALANVTPDVAGIDWNEAQAQAFKAAMNDDFNSSGAVAALFELAGQVNRERDSRAAGQLKALGAVLGLLQQDPAVYFQSSTRYSSAGMQQGASQMDAARIEALIAERGQAKLSRDFARADAIRAELRAAGIELDDKPGGMTQWRRA
ncbi:cysteine--tRNA ligase [Bordetella avium]|uniref:Cysteine--tRNA ligase n=1 Tax=Bordetella avium (strain 197N) TaxID=360910 RepID=SYC_BORA1|nr:cysteine--tRNA ligase [Bordetella avium]Q2KX38.1 RecName: Full=Cysteine--tRNA ligase; AltName: Full=Cysteinyl-tRNA synthetase; Short=CysRS [Bordetella avium 197N]AZY53285.1 cysteine--tRNA ligase [Bordetella avium]RIQ17274.1 cysteine--tRNA ligase [Bordetella avium]RIQ33758.1 cysteine--tRNA ligase [Bordetella avium]RIQ51952.1 cysteine--tRNA ligase [Bordetella avium]RIQ68497.1 cysteine--tRNA ligase [Bordetella avium]